MQPTAVNCLTVAMLQAHSLLWHYLWVAPNLFLVILGLLILKRGLRQEIPAFVLFAFLSGFGQLAVYAADVVPSVSGPNFWRVDCISLSIESALKFIVVGEVFSRVFDPYPSISKLGKYLVSAVGVILVFTAAVLAAISHGDSTYRLISGAHLLELTVFIVESGLIVFVFLIAAYFRMPWDRLSFGVLLGLGFSSCVHLATWATMTNMAPTAYQRTLLDFVNMVAYHTSVAFWFYYVLVPHRPRAKATAPLPESSLETWNRELERLIHQ